MDRQVSIEEFLKAYHKAVEDLFKDIDKNIDSDSPIYGHDVTVHWNGIYCNLGDGAIPYNYIAPALEGAQVEYDA